MNWLITGGCGFIGTNLVKMLLKESKNKIRVLDNFFQGKKEDLSLISEFKIFKDDCVPNFSSKIQLIEADILNLDIAHKITRNVDVVVHLAGNTGVQPSIENPRFDCNNNIIGLLNYLEAAKENNVKRFIYSSSSAAVGEQIPPINELMPSKPLSPYGASKLSGEGYCHAYYNSFSLNTIVLRFGNVYGPGSKRKESVIAKFIKKIINDEIIEVYGDGNQTRDFIYVDDLVEAIIACSEKENIGGEIFQIANNKEVTINEIIKYIKTSFSHKKLKVEYLGKRVGDIEKIYADITKANNLLEWSPKVSLSEGIKLTSEYFIKQ